MDLKAVKTVNRLASMRLIFMYETCQAWAEILAPSESELDAAVDAVQNQEEGAVPTYRSDDEDLAYLSHAALKDASKFCLVAYINLKRQNYEETRVVLEKVKALIDQCVRHGLYDGYVQGMSYVRKSLDLCSSWGMRNWSDEEVESELRSHLETYSLLPCKAKAGVLAIKQYFLSLIRSTAIKEQCVIIEQLIKLDPDNAEWHYRLYVSKKYETEADRNHRGGPRSRDELKALTAALQCPGAESNPRVLTAFLRCLASHVRAKMFRNGKLSRDSFQLCLYTFSSAAEAVKFIRQKSEEIFQMSGVSATICMEISYIFSSILPQPCQDPVFARICDGRALEMNPTSSRANHRVGQRLVQDEETTEEGLEHLRKAIQLNPKNFFAASDLLNILLEDVTLNEREIEELFASCLNPNFHGGKRLVEVSTLTSRGIYMFLRGHLLEATRVARQAYSMNPDCVERHLNVLERRGHPKAWCKNCGGPDTWEEIKKMFRGS